jgi:hypothetical protein
MESLATLLQKPQTLHRKFWNFIFQSHLGQAMILSIIIHHNHCNHYEFQPKEHKLNKGLGTSASNGKSGLLNYNRE